MSERASEYVKGPVIDQEVVELAGHILREFERVRYQTKVWPDGDSSTQWFALRDGKWVERSAPTEIWARP